MKAHGRQTQDVMNRAGMILPLAASRTFFSRNVRLREGWHTSCVCVAFDIAHVHIFHVHVHVVVQVRPPDWRACVYTLSVR